jgi:DNA-binding NarL/FixJ family response regulator
MRNDNIFSGDTLPKAFVEKMLETNKRHARQSAHDNEREENVCRLLASGISAEDISLVLKIRIDDIRRIESNNVKDKIPEYARTYKTRAKNRDRANR